VVGPVVGAVAGGVGVVIAGIPFQVGCAGDAAHQNDSSRFLIDFRMSRVTQQK
jgi:hypothetical protein